MYSLKFQPQNYIIIADYHDIPPDVNIKRVHSQNHRNLKVDIWARGDNATPSQNARTLMVLGDVGKFNKPTKSSLIDRSDNNTSQSII